MNVLDASSSTSPNRMKQRIRAITGCSEMDARVILLRMLDRGGWVLTPDRRVVRADTSPNLTGPQAKRSDSR